jgi:hypothetical protein
VNAHLNGNAAALLDHLRYVIGVSVRLTSAGPISIRPKAKLTEALRTALDACLPDLRVLLKRSGIRSRGRSAIRGPPCPGRSGT